MKPITSHSRIIPRLCLIFLLALLLAGAQYRILLILFKQNMGENIEAAKGVVEGYPHWKIYQGRILGPFLIDVFSKVTGKTFDQSYVSLIYIWLFLFYFIIMTISYDLRNSHVAIFASGFSGFALTALLMQGKWLYPWDFIDLIVFPLFIWSLLKRRSIFILSAILFLEIFNRNVAILLSAWLVWDALFILEGAKGRRFPKPRFHLQRGQFYSGLIMLFLSFIIIQSLQSGLLIREVGPEIFPDATARGNNWIMQLSINLQQFRISLTKIVWVYNIFILGIPIIALWGICSFPPSINRICLFHFILWLFTVTFGLIYETRVWLCFIPFLILVFPIMLSRYQDVECAITDPLQNEAV